jgi:hypothetical protein
MHSEIIHLYCIMTRLIYLICLIDAAILQFPAIHKKKPPRLGYRRTKINRKIYYLYHCWGVNFHEKKGGLNYNYIL